MKWYLISLCFSTLLCVSCRKDCTETENTDYFIFGHFYGECEGEGCIEIYRVDNKNLYEDIKDEYPSSNQYYEGIYIQLSDQNFLETKDLINSFPQDLLNELKNVVGQPDAGDWGGLYFEYNFNGIRKFWLIDQMKRNIPSKYHDFVDKINEKIKNMK
ncbi:MAG: hypothetical protein IPM34_02000 [Saprospiraceae bacterium]|nr:hypothetical protein [Saprospiraceae bacterium]